MNVKCLEPNSQGCHSPESVEVIKRLLEIHLVQNERGVCSSYHEVDADVVELLKKCLIVRISGSVIYG